MQAILITAYKNKTYLKKVINFFASKYKVYVHLDKKSSIEKKELKINDNVIVIKEYKINWGGINHLYAILELLKLALSDSDISYIHIISGQDIPVRPLADFDFFENNKKIFMECNNVEDIPNPKIKYRYTIGTLFPNTDNRKKWVQIINFFHNLGFRKHKIDQFAEIYKGLVWSSIPAEVGKYVLNYCEKNDFVKEWKRVSIPEEFFFQTILKNSKYTAQIVNNNLRYNDWHFRNGSNPAILDSSDISKIENGNYYFARKIDEKISKDLIKKYL